MAFNFSHFSIPAPQPSLAQYRFWAAAGGTLTWELVDIKGTTFAAGSVAYLSGAGGVQALIATSSPAPDVSRAVAAVVRFSTEVKWNTGGDPAGATVSEASSSSLSTWAASSVNLIGWAF